MGLASRLREVLEDRMLISHEAGVAKLREPGQMVVRVIEVPEDSTVIHVHKMASLKGLRPGVCGRRCDYLIVTDEREMDRAVFVELKKTLGNDLADGMDQLRQSRPILDYLHSVCRIHFDVRCAKSRLIVQYCLIGKQISSRIDKQYTKMSRPWRVQPHLDIKVAAIIVGDTVRFDELWSGA